MATCPPSLQVVRRFFFLSSLPESKGVVSVLWEDEVVCGSRMRVKPKAERGWSLIFQRGE
jgi:hypothetical protein